MFDTFNSLYPQITQLVKNNITQILTSRNIPDVATIRTFDRVTCPTLSFFACLDWSD